MNVSLWNGDPVSPFLNRLNMLVISQLFSANPSVLAESYLKPYMSSVDTVVYRGINEYRSPTLIWYQGSTCVIFFAGTSGTTHINRLIGGWTNPDIGPYSNRGANPTFAGAWLDIVASMPPAFFTQFSSFYLIGHSYGGAVAQAASVILRSSLNNTLKTWSYGSPRPGNSVMQAIVATQNNVRFFCDDDPVRFIPPHSTECPSLSYIDDGPLVAGSNTQVQCPKGYQLAADGSIQEYEGNPTPITAVGLNIAGWVADYHGFRSVLHSPQAYIDRFNIAVQAGNAIRPKHVPNPLQGPEVLTLRDRGQVEAEGYRQLVADAGAWDGVSNSYTVPQIPADSPLRYRRKKMGVLWGVEYDGYIVAIGPGKRRAGSLARRWNRAARAYALAVGP